MKPLAVAAIVWPGILASVVWARQGGHAPLWTMAVYAIGARICHQLPDRSFFTHGVQWPVCARCAGLYAAAPVGAILAWASRGRRWPWAEPVWPLFLVAALPTAVTLAIEWPGFGSPSNLTRAVAALPLGAAVTFLIVRAAAGRSQAIG
jgi:uncharacterized membrane protein